MLWFLIGAILFEVSLLKGLFKSVYKEFSLLWSKKALGGEVNCEVAIVTAIEGFD